MCGGALSALHDSVILAVKEIIMNTFIDVVAGYGAHTAGLVAQDAPGGGSRQERNRQKRVWRKSPANPRNQSRRRPGMPYDTL